LRSEKFMLQSVQEILYGSLVAWKPALQSHTLQRNSETRVKVYKQCRAQIAHEKVKRYCDMRKKQSSEM